MTKRTYSIILNVEVTEDKQPGRTEYYYRFRGWKHGIITDKNAINFEGKNISVPYSRWSAKERQELGEVIHDAAAAMMREDK